MTKKRMAMNKRDSDLIKLIAKHKDIPQEEIIEDMLCFYLANFIEPKEDSEDVLESMLALYLNKWGKELTHKDEE